MVAKTTDRDSTAVPRLAKAWWLVFRLATLGWFVKAGLTPKLQHIDWGLVFLVCLGAPVATVGILLLSGKHQRADFTWRSLLLDNPFQGSAAMLAYFGTLLIANGLTGTLVMTSRAAPIALPEIHLAEFMLGSGVWLGILGFARISKNHESR